MANDDIATEPELDVLHCFSHFARLLSSIDTSEISHYTVPQTPKSRQVLRMYCISMNGLILLVPEPLSETIMLIYATNDVNYRNWHSSFCRRKHSASPSPQILEIAIGHPLAAQQFVCYDLKTVTIGCELSGCSGSAV